MAADYTDNAVIHDLNLPSDKIFRPGVLYFGFEPTSDAVYTIPENVFFGGGITGVLNDLNCESLKVGYPTTNCDWANRVGRAGNGYTIVQMFALLATCEEYCGPENMLKFRENGVQIYPYVIGGGGAVLPANTKAFKYDRIIRNPQWENDAVDLLDVVDPQGPFDQDFGFCD